MPLTNWPGPFAAPKPRTLLVRRKHEWVLACEELCLLRLARQCSGRCKAPDTTTGLDCDIEDQCVGV